MSFHQWVALAVAIYLAFIALVAARFWRVRQAERRLLWPASTTQRQMENAVARLLTRRGWRLSMVASHAGKSLYGGMRDGMVIYVLILRDPAFFGRLIRTVRNESAQFLPQLALVLFDPPTPQMLAAATELSITLVRYQDLPAYEALFRPPSPAGVMTASLTRTG